MHLDPLVAADNSLADSSGPTAGIDPAADTDLAVGTIIATVDWHQFAGLQRYYLSSHRCTYLVHRAHC